MGSQRNVVENFQQLFANGMKRAVATDYPMLPSGSNIILNLGSGNSPMAGAINLDRPDWEAPYIDENDSSVNGIHAYHFFEHLTYETLVMQMREIDRVLQPGGLLYYCVPYAMSPIAFMDASHKTFWTEETMRTLLDPRGYSSGYAPDGHLTMISQVIAGINSQNLAVLGVLTKESPVRERAPRPPRERARMRITDAEREEN